MKSVDHFLQQFLSLGSLQVSVKQSLHVGRSAHCEIVMAAYNVVSIHDTYVYGCMTAWLVTMLSVNIILHCSYTKHVVLRTTSQRSNGCEQSVTSTTTVTDLYARPRPARQTQQRNGHALICSAAWNPCGWTSIPRRGPFPPPGGSRCRSRWRFIGRVVYNANKLRWIKIDCTSIHACLLHICVRKK